MTRLEAPPAPVRHPPVDPRFRRRWAEARKQEGRKRLRLLLIFVVACLVLGAGVGVVFSPVFKVRHVRVEGNAHTPGAAVVAAAGLAGPNNDTLMVHAGSSRAIRAVDALPWVGSVSFARHWPWTISIRVTERVPVAVVGSGSTMELVDRTGRVLQVEPSALAPKSLPAVLGARSAAPGAHVLPGPGFGHEQLQELLQAAAAAPQALARRDLKLVFSGPAGLAAHLGSAKALILLGDTSAIATKWAVLEEIVQRVGLSGYAQVDLTVPQRPALTPLLNQGDS